MRRWLCIGGTLALVWICAGARAGSVEDFRRAATSGVHYSLTRQFIVHDPPPLDPFAPPPRLNGEKNVVRIDPTLLAVSCERIKKALLAQLGARDEWKGKIFIVLHYAQSPDEPIVVAPELYGGEWVYRMDMPDMVERSRLISGIVEILLLEMAERNSARATEIPAWLSQGMGREVIFGSDTDLVLEPPKGFQNGVLFDRLTRTNLLDNPLMQAHEELLTIAPLSLDDLSWPKPGQFDGAAGEAYRSSAQLFVHELLQLPDGKANMQALLRELPKYLNWQLAFRSGFKSDFAGQLDLEKWWALRVVQFTGRNLAQTFRPEDSWQKLDEIVHPIVEVRSTVNETPARTQVTLQSVIREWNTLRQISFLKEKSQQLMLLRLRVSQDLIFLVDDYRRTIDGYVKRREGGSSNIGGRTIYAPRLDDIGRDAIRTLDVLEARRQQLRPNPQSAPAITANTNASN